MINTQVLKRSIARLHLQQCRLFSGERQRNKKLASVIREGLAVLNESAITIQAASQTRRPLFPNAEMKSGSPGESTAFVPPSDRARAEEYRIFSTAQECLETLASKHSIYLLQGEPICLLACHVKPSIQVATLFWTLPLSILLEERLTPFQKEQLLEMVQQRFLDDPSAKALLQRCVHSKLSSYYPPKLRLEPATEEMVNDYMEDDWK